MELLQQEIVGTRVRLDNIEKQLIEAKPDHDRLIRMETKLDGLQVILANHHKTLDSYVTRDQFSPVRMFVYGIMSLIGTAVFSSLLYMVLSHANPSVAR